MAIDSLPCPHELLHTPPKPSHLATGSWSVKMYITSACSCYFLRFNTVENSTILREKILKHIFVVVIIIVREIFKTALCDSNKTHIIILEYVCMKEDCIE